MTAEPDKVDLSTPDLTLEKLAALQELFPGVAADGVLDAARLGELVDLDVAGLKDGRERYGLMWAGKHEAVQSLLTPSRGTLVPDVENSVNFDTAEHVFIEGDNLEVLKLLQKAYNDQVKLIYIDPPYNTGNDFVYKDDFSDGLRGYLEYTGQLDEEGNRTSANADVSGRRHSRWLSMMYPRLVLARNLLRQDGLIFVSIDDNELHNLRSMMDEVFGAESFLGMITRSTGTPTGGGFDGFVNLVDYMLVYGRSPGVGIAGVAFSAEDGAIYNEQDDAGKYLTRSLRRTGGEDRREDRPSMYYGVPGPDGKLVFPIGPTGYQSRWICARNRFDQMEQEGLIEWKQVEENGSMVWKPYQKFYLEGRLKRPSNLWTDVEGNKKGTRELRDIFGGEKLFDSPKPVGLLSRIIEISTDDNDLVVDFFAGSGSTAHAVLAERARSGVSLRFILVQLPEATPAGSSARAAGFETISDLAWARVKTVMDTLKGTKRQGLRTLALNESNFEEPSINDDLLQLNAGTLVSDQFDMHAVAQEVFLKEGVRLDAPWAWSTVDGAAVVSSCGVSVVLTTDVTDGVVKEVIETKPRVLVFLEDGFEANDSVKANAFYACQQASIIMKTV